VNGSPNVSGSPSVSTKSSVVSTAQRGIDMLFENQDKSAWEPEKPPEVLGELLDSRYMLPLLFPSDPRMLCALPGKPPVNEEGPYEKRRSVQLPAESLSASRASGTSRGTMAWRSRNRKLREVGVEAFRWVDGVRSASRWSRPVELDEEDDDNQVSHSSDDLNFYKELRVDTNLPRSTPLTRKPSGRSKKQSGGDITPIDRL
jgi:hypothetical protein